MVCFNPHKVWKLNYNSLPEVLPANLYQKQKKITFKKPINSNNYTQLEIPCGTCLGCRLDSANSWSVRIMCETQTNPIACFITLTYAPEHLPLNDKNHMTLVKRDLQLFIKRLRQQTGKKLSYFMAGEYGSQTHRPHAHLILWGYCPKDLKLSRFSATENKMFTSEEISKIWGKGYIAIEEVNYKTACYVARYVQKKAGITPTKRKLTGQTEQKIEIDERNGQEYIKTINKRLTEKFDKYGREKEFIIMSKKPAIGLKYWQENKEKIKRNKGILLKIDDKTVLKPIPRYYQKLWERENWEELYQYKYECQINLAKNRQETLKKINITDKPVEEMTEDEKIKIYNEYLKNNLTNRGKYLKRNQI